jgi:O-antigen/teichoic acid export membrane protein
MGMSRTGWVVVNALTSYGRLGLSLIVFFFLTPYFIRTLGAEDYGLWVLAFSLVGFLGLLDLGFGTGVVKYVAEYRGTGDVERRNQVLSTVLPVYLGLAGAAAAGVFGLTLGLQGLFDIPSGHLEKALWVFWIIAARSVILSLPLSLFKGILFGEQKIYLLNGVQGASTLLYAGFAWLTLEAGLGLVALALVNLGVMLVEHAGYVVLSFRIVPDLHLSPKLFRRDLLKEVGSFSLFSSVVAVAALVLLRTDPVIIKLYLPLSAVAVYAVALKIAEYGVILTKQLINVLTPLMAELHGSGEGEKIRFLLLNTTRFALAPALAGVVIVCVLGSEVLEAWVGPEFSAAWPILVILMVAGAASVPQMMASNVLTMTGHHRFTAMAAALSVALNLGASLLLIRPWGLLGVATGTLIATLAIDLFFVVPRALRVNGIGASRFLRRLAPSVVIPSASQFTVTLGFKAALTPESLFELGLVSLPGLIVFVGTFWIFCMEDSERAVVKGKVLRAFPPKNSLAGAEI